jgi:hypothetical protein
MLAVAIQVMVPQQAWAAQLHGTPATYQSLVRNLQPGDELALEAGVYRDGLTLHGLRGSREQPIRIHGPVAGPPAVFTGRTGHNTISLSNTAHVHIRGLVLDGRNLEVDAVKAEGSRRCSHVHHIVLQDLFIIGHGADQQVVGISSMCPAWNWVIRGNVIVGAGTGLYLGRPDGSAPFVGGLIEQNVFVDTRGYNVQIKHQIDRPAAAGLPSQRAQTVIRHNVFTKARNASSGPDARPNLLLGHFPREGAGSEDVYEVTNNVFFCSPGESLLQGEGNLRIAGNVFVNPAGNALSIQAHHDVPRRVTIQGNFVAASDLGISITKASPLHPQVIADNRLFSPKPLEGGKQQGNSVAPFPASHTALGEWLKSRDDSTQHVAALRPLILSASRVCSGQADDRIRASAGTSDSLLQGHPVCSLLGLLASSPARSPPQLEWSKSPDFRALQTCAP